MRQGGDENEQEADVTRVLVTGGAGKLGSEVVARLLARGSHARVLTHSAAVAPVAGAEMVAGDLVSGEGLSAALEGMRVVIHAASNSRQAQEVDVEGTCHLLEAARASGLAPHIVYVSIVGVDRSSYPYYEAKYAAESLVRESGLPWSILRATQFHSFVLAILRSLEIDTQPEVVVPEGRRFQSVEIGEVAGRLVALAEGAPPAQVEQRRTWGRLTYVVSAIESLGRLRPIGTTLRFAGMPGATEDDIIVEQCDTSMLLVINLPVFGGRLGLRLPGVRTDDRLLDVIVIQTPEPGGALVAFEAAMVALSGAAQRLWGARGPLEGALSAAHPAGVALPGGRWYRARAVEIETEQPMDLTLDGEVRGRTPAVARVAPRGSRILAPVRHGV